MFLTMILAIAMLFSSIVPVFASAEGSSSSSSTSIEYSNVLDDLKKDKTFDETAYPAYTYEEMKEEELPLMDVISIAESEHKELFLYIYNPTRSDLGLTAYQVSMYCAYAASPKDFQVELYGLNLLSFDGVFDKYLVKGYMVTDNSERYYNIVEISRPFNAEIDTSIDNGYTDDKTIAVGKQWCFYYFNDVLFCEMQKFKVLEITPTLNGNIYFSSGITWGSLVGQRTSCNAHFIAFNMDNYIAKHIYDADLSFKSYEVSSFCNGLSGEKEVEPQGDPQPKSITLLDTDEVVYEGPGLFSKEYSWNRIMTAESFIRNFEEQGGVLNEASKETLQESQWVFAFAETEYKKTNSNDYWGSYWEYYTKVSEVDILRVHFMDNTGKFYNLGVVGDKTTADDIPDGVADDLDLLSLEEMLEKLMAIVLIVGLLLIYSIFLAPFINPIISMLIKAFLKGIGFIISFAFKIITLPLRLLFGLFKRK